MSAPSWTSVVDALERVCAGDMVTARLPAISIRDVVGIAGIAPEQIAGFGELHEAGDAQQLRFRFVAPRQGLGPLVAGARRLLRPEEE